jgi:hypothetical protein
MTCKWNQVSYCGYKIKPAIDPTVRHRVPHSAKLSTLILLLLQTVGYTLFLLDAGRVLAQTSGPETITAPNLVLGFTGGYVHAGDLRHSEAQLAQRLRQKYSVLAQVEIFENRQLPEAHQFIIEWLARVRDAGLKGKQTPEPRIILFGHSWGASAVVYLARQLERDDIPVALTIQVDSIRKHGEDDSGIPANVAEAVNFYQPNGILHGQRRITASNPSRTTIIGNYQFSYPHEPAACRSYPWFNRFLFKTHTAIECDPQVWSEVETLIETRLASVW